MSFASVNPLPHSSGDTVMLSLSEVVARVGLGRSSIYAMMKRGDFPKQVRVGMRRVVWVEEEVDAWLQSRIDARQ